MSALVLETVQWSSLPDVDSVEPINELDYNRGHKKVHVKRGK